MPPKLKAASTVMDHVLGRPIQPEETTTFAFELAGVKTPVVQAAGAVTATTHRASGVHLLVGRGATLAGVAKAFLDLWRDPPGWARGLIPAQLQALGVELFRFGTGVALGTELAADAKEMATYWANGVLLPVPALLGRDAAGGAQLSVDLTGLEAVVRLPVLPQLYARQVVGSLLSFDPFVTPMPFTYTRIIREKTRVFDTPTPGVKEVLEARAAIRTAYDADPEKQAALWRQRLIWNPYAATPPLVHLLSTLPAAGRTALVTALFDPVKGVGAHEYDRLVLTSAGIVLLRVCVLVAAAEAGAAAAIGRIAGTLGVPAADLTSRLRKDAGREPPLPASANLTAPRKDGLSYAPSFLGRQVALKWTSYKQDSGPTWSGPASPGSMMPGPYGKPGNPYGDMLKAVGSVGGTPLTDPQHADRLLAIRAICDIEGFGDAVRSADRALVSLGLQQFSFHVNEEGSVLLRRFRGISNVWFDVFIRSAGFDVGRAPREANSTAEVPIEDLQKGKVEVAPVLPWPVALSAGLTDLNQPAWLIKLQQDGRNRWCVPGRLAPVPATGKPAMPTVQGAPGEVHLDCHQAFGFDGFRAGEVTEDFLVRWAVAARLVPEVMQAEMEAAVHRFTRLQLYAAAPVTIVLNATTTTTRTRWEWIFEKAAVQVTMPELFYGPVHAAALIDCFINTPGAALGAARRAFDRAVAGWHDETDDVPVDVGSSRFRARFLLAYLSERHFLTGDEPPRTSKLKNRTVGWEDFTRRAGTNNVAGDRIARLLDRLEEARPPSASDPLQPRSLTWTRAFAW